MTDSLSQFSVLSLYSSMAVYAMSFVLFTLDLAGIAPAKARLARIALSLTWVAVVLQLVATISRGIAASRVPWANMYEFALTGTLMISLVYLLVNVKWDLTFLGAFITGLVLLLLGLAATRYYVEVVPLPPALGSYWLVIHVFVATLGTGFFALGFALSITQLLRDRASWLSRVPDAATLETYAYRLIVIGFVFWTFTLIAGAIWADKAWGRYWGWDVKEVWTFIIWTIYAGYLHARATRGWRGSRSATLAIIGFAAVIFNFTVVNIFFKGLHAYSGL